MSRKFVTIRAICPVCNGRERPTGILIEESICQHCGDTGFVSVPFEVKEQQSIAEAEGFINTPAEAGTKVAVAVIIAALALLALTAFFVWQ